MILVCNNSAVPFTKTFIQIKGICFDHNIWLIYMLIDETIYAEKRVKQFMLDTMVGSVKEDRRTGKAEVSSEVHQKAMK